MLFSIIQPFLVLSVVNTTHALYSIFHFIVLCEKHTEIISFLMLDTVSHHSFPAYAKQQFGDSAINPFVFYRIKKAIRVF